MSVKRSTTFVTSGTQSYMVTFAWVTNQLAYDIIISKAIVKGPIYDEIVGKRECYMEIANKWWYINTFDVLKKYSENVTTGGGIAFMYWYITQRSFVGAWYQLNLFMYFSIISTGAIWGTLKCQWSGLGRYGFLETHNVTTAKQNKTMSCGYSWRIHM